MSVKIGFIGAGNMGGAILKGLASRADLEIHACDMDKARIAALAAEHGIVPEDNPSALTRACDYVVIAVKPQQVRKLLKDIKPELTPAKTLISIAAGLTVDKLRDYSDELCPVIRVMPNTPAMVGKGVFAVCTRDDSLPAERADFTVAMFAGLGKAYVLEEKLFDAFTSLAGCGPAYVFYFIDALIEAAVNLGLPRPQATEITLALFEGSTAMALQTGQHPAILREMVTSPAGSTIRACMHFDRMAVRGHIIDAVIEAFKRNQELG